MLSSTYSTYAQQPFNAQARQPRAIVTINGISVYFIEIEIQTTTFSIADNYSIVLPLNGQDKKLDLNFWASEIDMLVKIYVGFPINPNSYGTNDLDLLIVGDVDLMEIDPLQATVTISGRDLTSRLIDTKSSKKYANYSASQIATILAQKHGLTPVVTPTAGNVGTIYNNLQVIMTKEITEWDLITFLAGQYGYVVFVNGESLYFQPYPIPDPKTAFVLQYQPPQTFGSSPTFNGMTLMFKRSLTLARDVKVLVKVPHSPTGNAFTVSAAASRRQRPYLKSVKSFVGPSQTYSIVRAGLTREQAQQVANQLLSNITLHEVVMDASVPGNNLLRKDSIIQVKGTNSAFDQFYYSDVVYRSISVDGYLMRVNAKNHAPDNQVII